MTTNTAPVGHANGLTTEYEPDRAPSDFDDRGIELSHFDPVQLRRALNSDPEFRIKSQYLNARIRLMTGRQTFNVRFIDGEIVDLNDADTGFDSYDILLEGSAESWSKILRPVPPPFYQDFWSAKFHHGFRIEGNLDLMSAYYAAIRRVCDVMRSLNGSEVQP